MRLRALCPIIALAASLVQPLAGEDAAPAVAPEAAATPPPATAAAPAAEGKDEYAAQRKELEDMLTSRDLELFELQFTPGKLGRIVLVDRLHHDVVFNYLTFTLRNEATMDASEMATKAKGYNEVLQSITQQFESAKIDSEGGVRLRIEGVEGPDGVILERTESKPRSRKVSLTVLATTENGTRIRLLDEPPGSGPQETFAFPDLGEPQWSSVIDRVREKVEEREGRKLLTLDEIRTRDLPPFDGVTRVEVPNIEDPEHDMNGWFVGEIHGVILFTKLSDYGDFFTVQVNGLSNKLRFRGDEAEPGKQSNYFQAQTLRRTYVMKFSRPGDEFYRDLDRFVLTSNGYSWVDCFQRTDIRRTTAYARYFLDNIATEQGALNTEVEDKFWPYYDDLRKTYGDLPDLKAGLAPK